MTNPVPTHAPKTDTPARPRKQPSGSWGGEVYLVRDVEDYVSRVESTLAAERASRLQADTGQFNAGWNGALAKAAKLPQETDEPKETRRKIRALVKPSVSPEQESPEF